MKKSTKILTLTSMATGTLLGVLFAPGKGSETRRKLKKELNKYRAAMKGDRKIEKLYFVKAKLEEHKARLEGHLQRINAKIQEHDAVVPAGS